MLEVNHITKSFEGQPLLRGVSFRVEAGETICLLGSSGSGKSTLLRIITGLEQAESGAVLWDGADLADVPVHKRNFGLMFQDYALFPHRNVFQNVAFGLRMQGLSEEIIKQRVGEALEQVHMAAFAKRRVTDLSGGEQQRVALARALAPRPRLLLLDEPLGALDRGLREQLIEELRKLLHETGIPAIYVTHDQEEAFALADRLVLLHGGRVEQEGTPESVYHRPSSAWTARFLGLGNLIEGTAQPDGSLRTALGSLRSACADPAGFAAGAPVTLLIQPDGAAPVEDGPATLSGVVEDCVFRGSGYRVELRAADGSLFTFHLARAFKTGEHLALSIPPEAILCLGPEAKNV